MEIQKKSLSLRETKQLLLLPLFDDQKYLSMAFFTFDSARFVVWRPRVGHLVSLPPTDTFNSQGEIAIVFSKNRVGLSLSRHHTISMGTERTSTVNKDSRPTGTSLTSQLLMLNERTEHLHERQCGS